MELDMNIFAEQMMLEKEARSLNKVVPIPTRYMAEELHKQGKVIVMRPNKPVSDDDFPPEAA
jgi:hypothetical protein